MGSDARRNLNDESQSAASYAHLGLKPAKTLSPIDQSSNQNESPIMSIRNINNMDVKKSSFTPSADTRVNMSANVKMRVAPLDSNTRTEDQVSYEKHTVIDE